MDFVSSLWQQALLLFALAVLFFVPGYGALSLASKLNARLQLWERFVLAFTIGICLTDFFMLLVNRAHVPFTQTLFILYCGTWITLFIAQKIRKRKELTRRENSESASDSVFNFNPRKTLLAALLLFLTVFIKSIYLADTILPTSTDLGHHMYWVQEMIQEHSIPLYEEQNIIRRDGSFAISEPEPIADFIVGEHLPLAAIGILSKFSVISAFPALFLHTLNLLSIIALFVLSLRFFEGSFSRQVTQTVGLYTLLFAGPLYAIASPQTKYVSGGVIGNMFGNLFIPVILLCFFRALKERDSRFFTLGILIATGLFYTHHLSGFILLFVLLFSCVVFVIVHGKEARKEILSAFKLFFSRSTLILLACVTVIVLFVYLPNYLEPKTVGTAVGTPVKSTRTGLPIVDLMFSSGEARFMFGFFAMAAILSAHVFKRFSSRFSSFQNPLQSSMPLVNSIALTFLTGWLLSLFMMSWKPQLLFLNLPSGRIANYLSFPLIVLAALGTVLFFHLLRKALPKIWRAPMILTFAFLFMSGLGENTAFLKERTNAQEAVQTFSSASYLAEVIQDQERILKDHNYTTADSWIKLFFAHGYNFPFSRAYFKRYEDNPGREQCTLRMINAPNSPEGKACFHDLNVRFVMVNPVVDASQFTKEVGFWKIYENNHVTIFYRK